MTHQPAADPGVYIDLTTLLRLRRLPTADARARLHQGKVDGARLSRQRGRGLSFEELRHYRPGDDCRLLDWKATRRAGHPLVRVFAEERERPVWLLVDQRSSMFFGSQRRMKSVFAAELAALIGWKAHADGDRVGSLLVTDSGVTPVRPQRTQAQLLGWLKQLVASNRRLKAGCPPTPERLREALADARALISHDARIYLLSDLNGWDQRCVALLGALRRHNEVVVVQIADPLERELRLGGRWSFRDHRGELTVDTRRAALSQRYQALNQQQWRTIRDSLVRHRVDCIALDCQTEPRTAWQRLCGRTVAGSE